MKLHAETRGAVVPQAHEVVLALGVDGATAPHKEPRGANAPATAPRGALSCVDTSSAAAFTACSIVCGASYARRGVVVVDSRSRGVDHVVRVTRAEGDRCDDGAHAYKSATSLMDVYWVVVASP